jgi:hypothetical protein
MLTPWCKLVLTLLAFCGTAHASRVNFASLSFDVLMPSSSGMPQVDVFNIVNFTGDSNNGGFDLPPDFPVATPLTLTQSTLTVVDNTGTHVIPLGDIGPGPLTPPGSLQFPDTDMISSATFHATLDQINLVLSDGSAFVAMTADIQALLVPSVGSSLSAGNDFVVLTVSSVPEPGTFALMLAAFMALLVWSRRSRRPRQNDRRS